MSSSSATSSAPSPPNSLTAAELQSSGLRSFAKHHLRSHQRQDDGTLLNITDGSKLTPGRQRSASTSPRPARPSRPAGASISASTTSSACCSPRGHPRSPMLGRSSSGPWSSRCLSVFLTFARRPHCSRRSCSGRISRFKPVYRVLHHPALRGAGLHLDPRVPAACSTRTSARSTSSCQACSALKPDWSTDPTLARIDDHHRQCRGSAIPT